MKPENRKSVKSLIKEHMHEMSQEVQDLLNEHDYEEDDLLFCDEDSYDDLTYGSIYEDDFGYEWEADDWYSDADSYYASRHLNKVV